MPYSKKFNKMLKAMQKEYGKKEGLRIAHATAEKRNMRH